MRGKEPSRAESAIMLARAYPVRTLLVLLVVGIGLWFAAARLFPGESGNIRTTLDQIRDGLIEGNADKVLANVSPYFFQEGIDKAALGTWLRSALAGKPVDRVFLVMRQVQIHGSTADVSLNVSSFHRDRRGNTDWIVSFEKIDGRWLVRKAVPTRVNDFRTDGFRALFRIY
jgi:hypothetical protein